MRAVLLTIVASIAAASCGRSTAPRIAAGASVDTAAARAITPALLERHTRELSSARYEGRAPGTLGETLTVQYLEREFRRIGLRPGNPDGTFRQPFDLYNQRTRSARGRLHLASGTLDLVSGRDFQAEVLRHVPAASVDSAPMLFVGYGVVAPELGWDDYKDADVRGKLVVCLMGVPRFATDSSPAEPRGHRPTWYQRPEYKRGIAGARGAAGMVLLDLGTTGFARASERAGQHGTFTKVDDAAASLAITLARPASLELLRAAGLDSAGAVGRAQHRDARPLAMGSASFAVEPEWRVSRTNNVIGRLDGADPARRGEYVIFTAHWDAWGRGPTGSGVRPREGADSTNYGAADNAAGTAGLLAAAEAIAALRPRPPRTVLFIATSAEERGYAGSWHYARHPLHPLERTVGAVNIDLYGAPAGIARDVVIFGEGRSTLDDVVRDVVRGQGRRVSPDPVLAQGIFLRMDHLPFAVAGVPAVSLMPGFDLANRPSGHAKRALDEWVANRYHAPGDTIHDGWDWDGLALDMRTFALVGLRLARDPRWPEWKPTAEFYERRRRMLGGPGPR